MKKSAKLKVQPNAIREAEVTFRDVSYPSMIARQRPQRTRDALRQPVMGIPITACLRAAQGFMRGVKKSKKETLPA